VFLKNGRQLGSFVGKDAGFNKGTLIFTQQFEKVPPGVVWVNGATITVKADKPNTIAYVWEVSGSSGGRTLTRSGPPRGPTGQRSESGRVTSTGYRKCGPSRTTTAICP